MATSTVSQWWQRLRAAEKKAASPAEARGIAPLPEDALPPIEETVPRGLRIAGAWSWRTIALVAVIVMLCYAVIELRVIIIPLLIAIVLAALLSPLMMLWSKLRFPKWLAAVVTMLVFLGVVTGLMWLVVTQIIGESEDLRTKAVAAYEGLRVWLQTSPLQIGDADIEKYLGDLWAMIQKDGGAIWSGALSVGSTVGHVGAGFILTLFSLLFFLLDGRNIWNWFTKLMPKRARVAINGAGLAGWKTLTSYSKTQIFVATVDAVGIGMASFFLGVPLALPIGVLVFLGSFVPIVGAVVTGAVAVLIALIYNGLGTAIILLICVLLVQQLEGHVLQPLIMGSAVHIHPLAVVLAVTGGSMIAGIAGAFFAVPFVAVINTVTRYIASGRWRSPRQPEPEDEEPAELPESESPRPNSTSEEGAPVAPGDK